MQYGFRYFTGRETFIMLTSKKNVTDNIARQFTHKFIESRGLMEKWNNATDIERDNTIKVIKSYIAPVAIEKTVSSTGLEFMHIYTLYHAQNYEHGGHYSTEVIPATYFHEYIFFNENS